MYLIYLVIFIITIQTQIDCFGFLTLKKIESSLISSAAEIQGSKYQMYSDELYRKDGVRIAHDPYASGMAEKYGAPGKTDVDGFDPYADSGY